MTETKEHILNVSFGLFLQKSYKEVTLKDIVEKTGLSKGAFYHYFASKEQLFLEIIDHAFSSVINIDYARFNQDSLFEFYHNYINYIKDFKFSFLKTGDDTDNNFDLNYYSLIFDAQRLFPDFRAKMLAYSQSELAAWKNIIGTARKNGEIKSCMNDEQISSIFIHTSSGIGMHHIMFGGRDEDTIKAWLLLWDSIYAELKT